MHLVTHLFRRQLLKLLPLALALGFVSQTVSRAAQVEAALVAETDGIAPGQTVRAALELRHAPHWHTYWINPGTGLPTTLELKLPEGWTAGDLQWPVPVVLHDGSGMVVGQGYEGTVYIPFTLTAPASLEAGKRYVIEGQSSWLMCSESCVPGDAQVRLTLSGAAAGAKPAPSAKAASLAAVNLPQAKPDWPVEALVAGQSITLRVSGAPTLKNAHFYCVDDTIKFDAPQTSAADGAVQTLALQCDAAPKEGVRLKGVLSWNDATGALRGVELDLPLAKHSASTSAAAKAPASGGASSGGALGLAGTLLLAFVGGLILNLMPCVFPVLGIKIMGFVNQAGSDRRRVAVHGIAFTLGVLLSFWILAGVLSVLRAGGSELGWGFQLQSPLFVLILAVVMLVFAMSLSGVFEFGLGATAVGADLQMKQGYAGSFFTGILATVVATPCSAPFLAPALGAALTLPIVSSFAVFTAIGVGLSVPYLLLSLFPSAIKLLPRPGAWMETFRQFMAFPLYATVGYLVWVLAGQLSEAAFLNAIFGLCLVALAVWFYGRFCAPGSKPGRVRFGYVAALLAAGLGLWVSWPRAEKEGAPTWEHWSPEAVAKAQAAGKTVYVDFTARWCATCQANKKLVFGSDTVNEYIRKNGIVLLKADWTNRDPQITAELARWSRSAVPFNIVYRPGKEPKVLPELLNPGLVLKALEGGE